MVISAYKEYNLDLIFCRFLLIGFTSHNWWLWRTLYRDGWQLSSL